MSIRVKLILLWLNVSALSLGFGVVALMGAVEFIGENE